LSISWNRLVRVSLNRYSIQTDNAPIPVNTEYLQIDLSVNLTPDILIPDIGLRYSIKDKLNAFAIATFYNYDGRSLKVDYVRVGVQFLFRKPGKGPDKFSF
jgi:hypothetical protein